MCCVAAAAAAAAAWTVDAAAVWAAVRGGWCSLFGGSEVPSCCSCSSGFSVAAADVSERSASLGGAHVFFIPPTGPWLLFISLPLARGVSEPEKSSTLDSSSLKTLVLIKLFSTEKLRQRFFSTFKWLCLIYIQLTLFSWINSHLWSPDWRVSLWCHLSDCYYVMSVLVLQVSAVVAREALHILWYHLVLERGTSIFSIQCLESLWMRSILFLR